MYKIEHLGKEILKMMLTVEEMLIQHSVKNVLWPYDNLRFGRRYYREDFTFGNGIEESIGVSAPIDQLKNIQLKGATGSQLHFENDVLDCLLLSCCASGSCQLVNQKGFCFIL